jgi:hypothetical protein
MTTELPSNRAQGALQEACRIAIHVIFVSIIFVSTMSTFTISNRRFLCYPFLCYRFFCRQPRPQLFLRERESYLILRHSNSDELFVGTALLTRVNQTAAAFLQRFFDEGRIVAKRPLT